nr:MAG TPA: hypothetical protein [Bacteriophage sp.]
MVVIKSENKEALSKVAAILVLSSTRFTYELDERRLILEGGKAYRVYLDLLAKGFDADIVYSETIILV